MPHGSVTIGTVEIVALCDGIGSATIPAAESFPMVPPEEWAAVRLRFSDTFDDQGRWRLHVHCYLIRAGERIILVDTGIGPATSLAAEWFGSGGLLPGELLAAGMDTGKVDTVVLTHLHTDHIGWVADEGRGLPGFPNARVIVQRADVDMVRADEEEIVIDERVLRPIEGALEILDADVRLSEEILIVRTPGHTPGHQSVLVESEGERVLIAGDLMNHPMQVENPDWSGNSDADAELAALSRRRFLDLSEREGLVISTGHFPEPFGRAARDDAGRRRWSALKPS